MDEGDPPPAALSRRDTLVLATGAGAGAALATGVQQALAQDRVEISSDGVSYIGPGGRKRPIAAKLNERVSVLDFDVDPKGRNDSTAGFARALRQLGGGTLFVPNGTYLVERLGELGPAGQQIVGESRWRSILRSEAGAAPVFFSAVARQGTSAFHLISDLTVDLNGQGGVAFDLASINASTIQRVHVTGGGARPYRGIGVRFAAPLQRGAYDNALYDCTFEYLDRAIVWETGANANSVFNCRVNNCRVGFDCGPAGEVDTPRIFGGRVEGCDIGLIEGSSYGGYFALRFEDNRSADIVFTERSIHAAVWGGLTATSRLVLKDLDRATSPRIESADLGDISLEENPSRPRISSGRHVFGAAGKRPAIHPRPDYAAYFADYALFRNGIGVEFSNTAGDHSISGMAADAQGRLVIGGYDRKSGVYATVVLGGGDSVEPVSAARTDLGAPARPWKAIHLDQGVFAAGKQVLGRRGAAIADDRSGAANSATVNQILAALRRHGLIER